MRLPQLQRQMRRQLAWYLVGFVVIQAGLAVALEWRWTAVRDPGFAAVEQILRQSRTEAPGRPMVLVLGSSRTRSDLQDDLLNRPEDKTAPFVLNAAMAGGGPMLAQIFLRRLLAVDIRPDLVFIEISPMFLSARDGVPIEEAFLPPGRLTAVEAARLWTYYKEPSRLRHWATARLLPIGRHQAEVHDALALDLPVGSDGRHPLLTRRPGSGRASARTNVSAQEIQYQTRVSLQGYASALTEPAVAPGAVRAYRDVVRLCQDNHMAVVLFMPPENSAFRSYAPAVAERHVQAVRGLAEELGAPLIDARTWIDDDGFADGHHAFPWGAEQFTDRFGREALARCLSPGRPGAASVVRGGQSTEPSPPRFPQPKGVISSNRNAP